MKDIIGQEINIDNIVVYSDTNFVQPQFSKVIGFTKCMIKIKYDTYNKPYKLKKPQDLLILNENTYERLKGEK